VSTSQTAVAMSISLARDLNGGMPKKWANWVASFFGDPLGGAVT
jgi:hypothetical protein